MIDTLPLFQPLHDELIALLRSLHDEDWRRPTVARQWRVRDIAAHLLDVQLRKLSAGRDNHMLSDRDISSYADVMALIGDLNAGGVAFAQRLSPLVLVDLLEVSGPWVIHYMQTLSPMAPARFAVAWAGERVSPNWMDIGREYTEWWHHQMQIRDAVGAPLLLSDRWMEPLLGLSVRAFPHALRDVAAAVGTVVVFGIQDAPTLTWSLTREAGQWSLLHGGHPDAAARVLADRDTAWRILYNAVSPVEARLRVDIAGDRRLAESLLNTRSVMV